jgi:large subunit ribosomal protein L31
VRLWRNVAHALDQAGDSSGGVFGLPSLLHGEAVKKGIHPEYVEAIVTCACGETWRTRSTKREIHLEVCSACHPFFTGKQKYVDSAGRVERFQKKYGQRPAGEAAG